ncbi:MAG: enoyl-CoA hydratase/isomerase family protein [bacterium]|nr:enoyl-CoA hydratase/isomerase family protein [bacterium]
MNDILLEDRHGSNMVLTLNDPDRANPLSPAMATALDEALQRAQESTGVRAVILAGAGRHFSAGADLAALEKIATGGDQKANQADSQVLECMFATLLDHPKLTVAAVDGAAIAGGCGLATACDFVVTSRAARFSYTEVKIGFIPALVSTFLTRRVSGQVARKLLLDPEILDGESAVAIGLADELVEPGAALDRALQLADAISRKASPSALTATKRLLNQAVGRDWRSALRIAAEANVGQRMESECRLGVRTFLESKTTPDWLAEEDPRDDP